MGYFEFCETVTLQCHFTFAQWEGHHENQPEHLGYLLRHGIPLIWKNGAAHCEGLKVPKINIRKGFAHEVRRLLKPQNLIAPNEEIEVKSARIGEVMLLYQFNDNHYDICHTISITMIINY